MAGLTGCGRFSKLPMRRVVTGRAHRLSRGARPRLLGIIELSGAFCGDLPAARDDFPTRLLAHGQFRRRAAAALKSAAASAARTFPQAAPSDGMRFARIGPGLFTLPVSKTGSAENQLHTASLRAGVNRLSG